MSSSNLDSDMYESISSASGSFTLPSAQDLIELRTYMEIFGRKVQNRASWQQFNLERYIGNEWTRPKTVKNLLASF